MTIHLKVENYDQMPDGGPMEISSEGKNLEIGRAIERDWTLPDPRKYISSRHCEIRHVDGGYWLHDLSSNGTFLNGSTSRLTGPTQLQDGDRIQIGHYYVMVRIGNGVFQENHAGQASSSGGQPTGGQMWTDQIWETGAQAPKPMDRRDFMPPKPGQTGPDFLQQNAQIPVARPSPAEAPSPFALPGQSQASQSPFSAENAGSASSESPFASPGMPSANEGFVPQMPGAASIPSPASASAGGQVAATDGSSSTLLNAIAAGAGIPPAVLSSRPPAEIGREIGEILALTTSELAQLLKGRAAAKKMVKSSDTTMIGAQDNNPLKFIPNTPEILEIMFMKNRQGYLDGPRSFTDGFKDLQKHEVATYAAMQKALKKLIDQLDPEQIEKATSSSSFGMKKSRAWETYVERWNAKTEPYDNGMLDIFLKYFAEAYDEAASGK